MVNLLRASGSGATTPPLPSKLSALAGNTLQRCGGDARDRAERREKEGWSENKPVQEHTVGTVLKLLQHLRKILENTTEARALTHRVAVNDEVWPREEEGGDGRNVALIHRVQLRDTLSRTREHNAGKESKVRFGR